MPTLGGSIGAKAALLAWTRGSAGAAAPRMMRAASKEIGVRMSSSAPMGTGASRNLARARASEAAQDAPVQARGDFDDVLVGERLGTLEDRASERARARVDPVEHERAAAGGTEAAALAGEGQRMPAARTGSCRSTA